MFEPKQELEFYYETIGHIYFKLVDSNTYMKFNKFLGAGLGAALGGPIGAILGFAIGNLVDVFSKTEIKTFREQNHRSTNHHAQPDGDFEIALLVLSSFVIKADGRIDQRELDYVRKYFLQLYGKERANNAFKLFREIVKDERVNKQAVCQQINGFLNHSSRIQLVHYLFGIALADGHVDTKEIKVIRVLGHYLRISDRDIDSIKALYFKEEGQHYAVLGITKSASDSEVKKAYRSLVKKYHPDKLQDIGEEQKKGAEEKFLEIQKAYEAIAKERKM